MKIKDFKTVLFEGGIRKYLVETDDQKKYINMKLYPIKKLATSVIIILITN